MCSYFVYIIDICPTVISSVRSVIEIGQRQDPRAFLCQIFFNLREVGEREEQWRMQNPTDYERIYNLLISNQIKSDDTVPNPLSLLLYIKS